MKKGAIIGIGSACFVAVFMIMILVISNIPTSSNSSEESENRILPEEFQEIQSKLDYVQTLPKTENRILPEEVQEIQSELDYVQTLPKTEEVGREIVMPLMEEMSERPSIKNTCTKIYNQYWQGVFEMMLINDFNSDGVITEDETKWAIANTPKLAELNEYEDVLESCTGFVQFYPEKFPGAITPEEIEQQVEEISKK